MSTARPLVAVLEDDAESSDALCLILLDWGADVLAATDADGLSAQLGADASRLGWIIADYDLGLSPDGVTGARQLLTLAPQARVLVLSGVLHDHSAAAVRSAGFHVMAKPANPAAIIGWLEQS